MAMQQVRGDHADARVGVRTLQLFQQAGGCGAAHMDAQVVHAGIEQALGNPATQESGGAGQQDGHAGRSRASTMPSIRVATRRMCVCGTGSSPRPSMAS